MISPKVQVRSRRDPLHPEPGRPDEIEDAVLTRKVAAAEGEEVGVWPVDEEVNDPSGHPPVPALDQGRAEVLVDGGEEGAVVRAQGGGRRAVGQVECGDLKKEVF